VVRLELLQLPVELFDQLKVAALAAGADVSTADAAAMHALQRSGWQVGFMGGAGWLVGYLALSSDSP
jgi:hypothetical protein